MPSPELIIFDCDGVLVDSEIIAARAESEMLAKAGFEITPEEMAQDYAGLTFKDILLRIEKEHGLALQASLIDEAETPPEVRAAAESLLAGIQSGRDDRQQPSVEDALGLPDPSRR